MAYKKKDEASDELDNYYSKYPTPVYNNTSDGI